jgi:hypothetical protein
MISFHDDEGVLQLIYEADLRWTGIDQRLRDGKEVSIRKTFWVSLSVLVGQLPNGLDANGFSDCIRTFKIGRVDEDYYLIDKNVLGLKHDLQITRQVKLESDLFIAHRNISIFSRIDALCEEPIIIGGDAESAIPIDEFQRLLKTFPTSTEVDRYAASRITRVLKDYLDTMSDAETKLQEHLRRKEPKQEIKRVGLVAEYETDKFEFVRDELKAMLDSPEGYCEADWQRRILKFILLIFPKYIAVLSELHINDFYSVPGEIKSRFIDLTLVDAGGTIDVIEIKKPEEHSLLSKTPYCRGNYTPKKALSGAVMQAEKYIFHLSKWGHAGEVAIQKARASELPPGLKIQVTNPKALLILGRDNDFTAAERLDFEIIKRKYANMMDILTYDDLLRRLNNIIFMMQRDLPSIKPTIVGVGADASVRDVSE